jgi:hypothetical protein
LGDFIIKAPHSGNKPTRFLYPQGYKKTPNFMLYADFKFEKKKLQKSLKRSYEQDKVRRFSAFITVYNSFRFITFL